MITETKFQPILALWAVPRSTSTAFERMMSQRGDHICVHEPFGEVWYSIGNKTQPPASHVQFRPGLTYDSVWGSLVSKAYEGAVFIKDFPHYVTGLHDYVVPGAGSDGSDISFLDAFNHTFLIRDPAKALTSLYGQWSDFSIAETGFAEQRQLFDLLTERLGAPPPVIDSDDLLDDPATITKKWCEAVGIDFKPDALQWGQDNQTRYTWYESGTWHNKLAESTSLKRQKRNYVSIDHNALLRESYKICLPNYEVLYRHRLRIN